MNRFGLGLVSVTLAQDSIGQVISTAEQCGIEGIEWSARHHIMPGDERSAQEASRLCSLTGITIASYASYFQAGVDDPQAASALVETALALGAPLVRVWAGRMGLTIGHPEQASFTAAIDGLLALGEQLAQHGLLLSLEHHRLTLTDGARETLSLIQSCKAQGLRLLTHWQPRPGLSIEDAETDIELLGSDLSHVHVFEWDARLRRFPLHEGESRWARQIAAAKRTRPDWPGPAFACLEFVKDDSHEQLLRDAAVLRRLLDAASGKKTDAD